MALAALKKVPLLFAIALAASAPAAAPSPAEYEVKAAFLFNFAKFVEWPEQSFPDPSAPFRVCLLGDSPFTPQLERVLKDKTVHDRPLSVKRIQHAAEAAGCQMLFVAPSEGARLDAVLAAVKDAPVLTVGDVERFAQRGGMIGFTLESQKVRFNINPAPASASGLKISSQLLKLAKIVQ